MKHYETTAGIPTRGETYAKLNELLIECEELCALMAHLHNTEDTRQDKLLGTGWIGVSGMMRKIRFQITRMAMNKLQ